MIIFNAIRPNPDQPTRDSMVEVGRIWIEDGHIHASGTENVLAIAKSPLETVFDGDINPATDSAKFIEQLPMVYHGTRFWAEEAPDETA